MSKEFDVGDKVRFVNQDDMNEYIGKIITYYEHNNVYEIEILEALDVVDEVPEVGGTDMPLEKIE